MLENIINKFYAVLFEDENKKEEIPYTNKKFMFFFTIITFLIVVTMISLQIWENISESI